jgi:hypothetical protein
MNSMQTQHEHKPFVNSEVAMLSMVKICAMSHLLAQEADMMPVSVTLAFVLHQCFSRPSWTFATNMSPIGSKNLINHALAQCWCPETPQNVCKKFPTPKSPKFVPRRRFHKRKSIRAGDPVQNRFFRVFALKGRNVGKTAIVAYFGSYLVQKRATVVFL